MTESAGDDPESVSPPTELPPPGSYVVITASNAVYLVEVPGHGMSPVRAHYTGTTPPLKRAALLPRVQEFTFDIATGVGRIAWWSPPRNPRRPTGQSTADRARVGQLAGRIHPALATPGPSINDVVPGSRDEMTAALLRILESLRADGHLDGTLEVPVEQSPPHSEPPTSLDPDVVGDPTNSADAGWLRAIGPCYTTQSLQHVLRLSRAAIDTAVHNLDILRLTTSGGLAIYPAFQVVGGAIVPRLRDVLHALREGADDPWKWAEWLRATTSDTHDQTGAIQLDPGTRPIQQLIAGCTATVIRAAERTAAAWRS